MMAAKALKALAFVLLAYLLVGIESPMLQQLDVSFYAPDLGLIAVQYVATSLPTLTGVFTVFAIGLLQDGFAMGTPVGMYVEIFVLMFLVTRFFGSKIQLRRPVPIMLAAFFGSLLASLLFFMLAGVFDRRFGAYGLVFSMMLPNALVTAPFAPLVFWLYGRVDALFSRKKRENLFFG